MALIQMKTISFEAKKATYQFIASLANQKGRPLCLIKRGKSSRETSKGCQVRLCLRIFNATGQGISTVD